MKNKLIEEVVIKDKKVETDVSEEEFQLSQLVGSYEMQPGVVVRLSIKNDSLNVLQTWDKSTYNIIKTSGNTFQIPGINNLSFTFSNLKDELTQRLTTIQDGTETILPRKKEIEFSGIDLNDYSGSYYSKELDVTYNFEIEKGILKAGIQDKQLLMDCNMSEIDQFTMELLGLVRFQRTDGRVSSFKLDSGRVKNLYFEKK